MITAEPGFPLCEDGDHDWEFVDDSFDHEFGTERIHYWSCTKCWATKDVEAEDYDDEGI